MKVMDLASIMSADPHCVGPEISPDDALAVMDDQDVRHLPVVEQGRLVGVLSDRDLLSEIGWLPARTPAQRAAREGEGSVRTVRELMHANVTTGEPDDSVVTAAVDLVVQSIGCLPVLRGDELVGMVTEMDLVAAFWRIAQKGELDGDIDPLVSERMAAQPVTVTFVTPVKQAVALCHDHHVRHLPVVDGERLVGVVSDRDLRAASCGGRHLEQVVGTIMVPYPVTLVREDRLSVAAERMVGHRISCLPVVDGNKLQGIVTLTDLLEHCISTLRDPETH